MNAELRANLTDESGFTLVHLGRLISEYRRSIAAITLLALVVSVGIAYVLKPMYRAEISLTLASSNTGDSGGVAGSLKGLAGLAGVSIGGMSGQSKERMAILHSHALIEEFIKRNNLTPALLKDDNRKTLWFAVKKFREKVLAIKEDSRSDVITITVDWSDPATAADWANGFAALANDVLRRRDMESSARNIEFLNQQLQKTNVVELQRVMYSLIESETKTLMLANSRPDYAFAVVDAAVPPELKARPARALISLIGAALGLATGILQAYLRHSARQGR